MSGANNDCGAVGGRSLARFVELGRRRLVEDFSGVSSAAVEVMKKLKMSRSDAILDGEKFFMRPVYHRAHAQSSKCSWPNESVIKNKSQSVQASVFIARRPPLIVVHLAHLRVLRDEQAGKNEHHDGDAKP